MEQKQSSIETVTDSSRGRIGATLAAARIAAGIELEDIARDSRVPLRHLRAIEADSHNSLPAMPYTIGFVKTLARAVGIDAEVAAARFRAETSKTAHVPAAVALEPLDERRLPPRELVMFSVIAVVLLVGGLIAYGAGLFDKSPPPPPIIVAGPPPAPPGTAPVIAPDISAESSGVAAVYGPTSNAGDAATLSDAVGASTAVPGGGQVTFTPTEDVWVKIYDAQGTTVKSGILTAGEVYIVPAEPAGLKLWTGKAGVLGIAVAGKPIAPLGGAAQTVKNVSLAPADLLALRLAVPAPAPATAVR